ncbi:HlyD family efflux transporter periplasmic adaptor subunit [Alcaligenes ammonioxydans]|jgi:HlyD family secretion protein|uniref:HlyD family efflux transporter periplasmic adaptor subunit n=1 Tax=Alcaligenes ammonioxydans TaxID=2582914 RepID=A0ABX8SUX4_9BURK|nr:HlyD family efflux transporter periplasmic adaptor subunit [Alcaligenes ammonioxydans]EJC62258.1 secretion protein HlyD family protein [Alcaligenes faecalis subsp. faecalis NCIB 8687]QBH18726.1 HlyD family efflux transporter periplasmic adaptor subunit [Alcaligenes faecalis]MCH1880720.1 HlyD family efflux transporter periplasmic adaptor subunit [Alcaligenes ammonioxydans]QXX79831.1 HlyD family efflux transporter periplasmic adaptor subunit [Alcaligenes ammonioxydans]HRK84640.1 HlyD family e
MSTPSTLKKNIVPVLIVAGVLGLGWWAWQKMSNTGPGDGFVSGNGRIEATEIDISTKFAGRIQSIEAREGDFVKKGEVLAVMQQDSLEAARDEAVAGLRQAENNVAVAQAQVALRESDAIAAKAMVGQRESELDAAQRRLARSTTLSKEGAASVQELDDDRARVRGAQAAVAASQAQANAAVAAINAAKAQLIGAQSAVEAAHAAVARIEADLRDSELVSPRDGRVQFRVAQPGEVLGAGGRVLNVLDLSDVYMTFFLPSEVAGKVALGSEVRLVLDAIPDMPVPATVSFVASSAQFTPKSVETASERQKLMFRVKAQIAPELLKKHLEQVKTGLPGVAWVKLDPNASWPESLTSTLTE